MTDQHTTDGAGDQVAGAAPASDDRKACPACPWRISNQGKRHPDGWYRRSNLRTLWAGLRRGKQMSCHPTDPGNPVSAAAQAAGYRPAPAGSQVLECTGSLVLVQREVQILDTAAKGSIVEYRRIRPNGLTRQGIAAVFTRLVFGSTPIGGGRMPRPNLNHDDIGYPGLDWPGPIDRKDDDSE